MNFALTEEQKMLQDSVARYLADRHNSDARRTIASSADGYSRPLWTALATELGLLGATFPEGSGGFGGGPIEMVIIARELGRALVTSPYLHTVILAGGILSRLVGTPARNLLEAVIAGDRLVALCDGDKANGITARAGGDGVVLDGQVALVHAAAWADSLIVAARNPAGLLQLFLIPAATAGVTRHDRAAIDGGRLSDISFVDVRLPAGALLALGGDARLAVEVSMDEAIVALCAEACGILHQMLDDTVAYARQRMQFGKAIGSFQVIQHRLVDMFMEVEQAEAATMLAAWQLADAPQDRASAASAAKVQVSEVCRKVGQAAIQLHGGIGMTDELALGHYFRRATMIEKQFGSADVHLRRFVEMT